MEKDFEELKALFQQKKASAVLSVQEVNQRAKSELRQLKKNHRVTIVTFLLTAVALVYIDRVSATKMETSAAGFGILMGCALYYMISKTYLLYRLSAIKPTESVRETLQRLEAYKKLNTWMHTYGEVAYVLVLGLGIYLYVRPVLDRFLLDQTGATLLCFWWIWGACIAWLFVYTFVIKRRRMRKDIRILERYMESLRPESPGK
ncbi:MAG: hypothetical protein KF870_14630 [Leadbetterella sp.]|nr:hypothetical protein [Leadbetterella sp.]